MRASRRLCVGGLLTVNTGVASDIDATERGIDAHSSGAGNIVDGS